MNWANYSGQMVRVDRLIKNLKTNNTFLKTDRYLIVKY